LLIKFFQNKIFRTKKTTKKFKTLNGLFEEEFLFEMEINSYILDYLKNKKTLITLYSSKGDNITNNNNYFDKINENDNKNNNKRFILNDNDIDTDSESEGDNDNDNDNNNKDLDYNMNINKKFNKEILGNCKFSFSEILTNSDFTNKNYEIFSLNSSKITYGFINVDLKLENTASIEGKIKTTSKNEKVKYKFLFIYI
jgi:hypothetical protein